jgi:hypothetical protein
LTDTTASARFRLASSDVLSTVFRFLRVSGLPLSGFSLTFLFPPPRLLPPSLPIPLSPLPSGEASFESEGTADIAWTGKELLVASDLGFWGDEVMELCELGFRFSECGWLIGLDGTWEAAEWVLVGGEGVDGVQCTRRSAMRDRQWRAMVVEKRSWVFV